MRRKARGCCSVAVGNEVEDWLAARREIELVRMAARIRERKTYSQACGTIDNSNQRRGNADAGGDELRRVWLDDRIATRG